VVNHETWVSAVLAACMAGVCAVFGAWSVAMTTLVILIGLDMASGWARAFLQKQLSSKESLEGLLRKTLIFVAIAVAAQADRLVGSGALLRNAVVLFYCASEGLSVIENLVAVGLPVPDALKTALRQLNERKYVERSS
jgi:toxin secretion/phage lysis holin